MGEVEGRTAAARRTGNLVICDEADFRGDGRAVLIPCVLPSEKTFIFRYLISWLWLCDEARELDLSSGLAIGDGQVIALTKTFEVIGFQTRLIIVGRGSGELHAIGVRAQQDLGMRDYRSGFDGTEIDIRFSRGNLMFGSGE